MKYAISNRLILLITLLLSNSVCAQVIKGYVMDDRTNSFIPYASIGIIGEHYGTYSGKDGAFLLTIKDYSMDDSLRISCIGYEHKTYSIGEIFQGAQDTVYLKTLLAAKEYELAGVYVYRTEARTIRIGNRRFSERVILGFVDEKEMGLLFQNSKDIFLTNVKFRLTTSWGTAPDSATLRFNIYDLKDGLPDKNILTQPIYFHLQKEDFNGEVSFDITDYYVKVNHDFAATFELVSQSGGDRVYITGQITGNRSIERYGQQGYWKDPRSDRRGLILKLSLIIKAQYNEKQQ